MAESGGRDGALDANHAPFHALILEAVARERTLDDGLQARVVELTHEVVRTIVDELTPSFWRPNRRPEQERVSIRVFQVLLRAGVVSSAAAETLTDRLLTLPRATYVRLKAQLADPS